MKGSIILVSGYAGSGKTTFSNFCIDYLQTNHLIARKVGFADKVKEIANYMLWDGEKDIAGRKLLQDIGRIGRDYYEYTWAANLKKVIENFSGPTWCDFVFVDDWRFPNEYDYLKFSMSNRIITVRLVRQEEKCSLFGTDLWNDESETSLPSEKEENLYYNYICWNTSDLKNLSVSCQNFCDKFLSI